MAFAKFGSKKVDDHELEEKMDVYDENNIPNSRQ
eukprot:CAMPEP_0202461262 /NCGR_PEP_ID=MMETSP1360-20130828/48499_1 /ASSEMBLY_ACC=CAM_ASM_000848 /TAXON_ID=515479 /ORGANISM="Licmophora paradoxa, Strain CCMP2313" /LENGTH=33 /DNA_ID= /DNA_START= /DNA_END= /DNA_ORIENTATION=